MDTSKIGVAAAQMMDMVEREYPENTEIVDVMVIICAHRPDVEGNLVDEDDQPAGDELVDYTCTSPRLLVHCGMLEFAREKMELGLFPSAPGDDLEGDD